MPLAHVVRATPPSRFPRLFVACYIQEIAHDSPGSCFLTRTLVTPTTVAPAHAFRSAHHCSISPSLSPLSRPCSRFRALPVYTQVSSMHPLGLSLPPFVTANYTLAPLILSLSRAAAALFKAPPPFLHAPSIPFGSFWTFDACSALYGGTALSGQLHHSILQFHVCWS